MVLTIPPLSSLSHATVAASACTTMSQSEHSETYGMTRLWSVFDYPGFSYGASLFPYHTAAPQGCQPQDSSDDDRRNIPLLGAPHLEQPTVSMRSQSKPAWASVETIRFLLEGHSIAQPPISCETPQRIVSRPAQCASGIYSLPAEMLLQIMHYLDPESIYSLRQTSWLFTQLIEDREFSQYLRPHCAGDNFLRFAASCLSTEQRDHLAKTLWRDMLCRSCHETRNGRGWERRLEHLREQLYCQGCSALHSRFLFFPQDIHDSERGLRDLECVGRRGRVHMCAHQTAQGYLWHEVESHQNLDCQHSAHQPFPAIKFSRVLSHFPRQRVFPISGRRNINSACDTPMLDIARGSMPALADVQESLIASLSRGLMSTSVCRHLQRRGRLPGFVRSGICECFAKAQGDIHPFPPVRLPNCPCRREHYLTCADCGAVCAWSLEAGRIYLSFRYDWVAVIPTSPQWLLFLNEESYVSQLFREESKHVLWCDDENCVLKYKRRWCSMIKEDMIQRCKQSEEGARDKDGDDIARSVRIAGELSRKTSYLLPQYSSLRQSK